MSLKKVTPRHIVRVTEEAKIHPMKSKTLLLGNYCTPDCAMRAYDRGIPRHL